MSDHNNNTSSYENLNPESKTLREGTPFTQISNLVINNIKNGDAFLVWCYLYSKSSNWKTVKSNIKNVYGFGDVKIKKIFSYLNRSNLIEYVQAKSANGKFAHVQIRISNGSKFDKTQAWLESAPHVQKSTPPGNHTNGNDELLNKENTKERKEHNTESNSATGVAQADPSHGFNEFWKIYPVKKNRVRAKKIWEKKKYSPIVVMILADVMKRSELDSQWHDKQYIPHPSTYLTNELWNDEVTTQEPEAKKGNGSDALSRVINKHLYKGNVYDHDSGNTIDPLR
jgi:hypothetical protein